MILSFLLILSLMTVSEASSKARSYSGGWVKFTCECSDGKEYDKTNGALSQYHDPTNGTLQVTINYLNQFDSLNRSYSCKIDQNSRIKTLNVGTHTCQETFKQTAVIAAKTTLTYDYPQKAETSSMKNFIRQERSSERGKKKKKKKETESSEHSNSDENGSDGDGDGDGEPNQFKVQFFCKDKHFCEGILPKPSTPQSTTSNQTNHTGLTDKGFDLSISKMSSHDAGVYWCGLILKGKDKNLLVSHQKIQLEVSNSLSDIASAARNGRFSLPALIIAAVICVVLVLMVVLFFKRFGSSKTMKEDHNHVDIEEHPHRPNVKTAPQTVYVTANNPVDQSAGVQFPNISGEVGGDMYSAVTSSGHIHIYSSVNDPSTISETPLYSMANMPQQH